MSGQSIDICEVGPRDGLQSEERHWSVEERISLIDRLAKTGLRRIEAVSFVSPKRVPQMAFAEDVMAGIARPDGVTFTSLALNVRGAERAIDAGVHEIRYVAVASETFNQRNQGASIEQTLVGFDAVAEKAAAANIPLSAGVAAAFGCPFEGDVPISQVQAIAKRFAAGGVREIWLADTNSGSSGRRARRDRRRSAAGWTFPQYPQYRLCQCGSSGGGRGKLLGCVRRRYRRLSLCAAGNRQYRHGRS